MIADMRQPEEPPEEPDHDAAIRDRQPSPALLAACRDGDRKALGQLIEAHLDMVHAAAYTMCGDRARAADLTQEVFLKVLTRIGQFREQASFTSWLYSIALNTWRDELRRSRRRNLATLEPPTGRFGTDRADQIDLRRALRRLPLKLRGALALRYGAELSYDEVARALGVPPGTAASRVHRGLRELTRLLR